jgi:hypothetical protein
LIFIFPFLFCHFSLFLVFFLTPLEPVVVFNIFIIFVFHFHSIFTPFTCFICLTFCKAQKKDPQQFLSLPIFSSSAKVWRSNFQVRPFFHQAQRFGAVIFKSAYFFIKRKGLAQ